MSFEIDDYIEAADRYFLIRGTIAKIQKSKTGHLFSIDVDLWKEPAEHEWSEAGHIDGRPPRTLVHEAAMIKKVN